MDSLIKTNENGEDLGTVEKIAAHTGNGTLHKAFSVFIFRKNRTEMLIQKRSEQKMLFGGYWANTCCSHPRSGEDMVEAAEKRLKEECGFTCPLSITGTFTYKAADPRGTGIEHEFDTVLIGEVDEVTINPDPEEIAELRWITLADLHSDLKAHPEKYAPWFPLALDLIPLHV